MPEFFLELFSEEIPARMQAQAAAELGRRCLHGLQFLKPEDERSWSGPRRIAFAASVNADDSAVKSSTAEARGPREGAPEVAVAGFLAKHGATRDQLVIEDRYFVLRRKVASRTAREIILVDLPKLLAVLPWPKSMRWGQGGDFTWVRPLRRIVCLLDGKVVPITLGPVTASNMAEGHRFMAPGVFAVASAEDWRRKLYEWRVIVEVGDRKRIILDGVHAEADGRGLSLVEDEGLLDEIARLVEWPVPLVGRIDSRFMSLPPEVRELSMRVNQRYFALRDALGNAAPYFAFVANIEAKDGGAAIIAGNERVLRARLADAEHFWTQDRKHKLIDYLPKLKGVVFHARLVTQYARAERIADLAGVIAEHLLASDVEVKQAEQAGLLAKADLVTGMVGEFPELQGIMGGYYADDPAVGAAIRTHYQPNGPYDDVPRGIVPCAVALADKLDTLIGFFGIGVTPTGSSDPFALRRAALGVIRIIRENGLRLNLKELCGGNAELFGFLIERLRVQLRSQGERYDVLDAVFAAGADEDIVGLLDKTMAVSEFLVTEDGGNLLAAYRRGANILRIEDAKDGPHEGAPDPALASSDEERALMRALDDVSVAVKRHIEGEAFSEALADLARLRPPVDAFFDTVKINADDHDLRKNRLRLLAQLRDTMHRIANFSKIEG